MDFEAFFGIPGCGFLDVRACMRGPSNALEEAWVSRGVLGIFQFSEERVEAGVRGFHIEAS